MKRILPAIVIVTLGFIAWALWPKSISDERLEGDQEDSELETADEIDSFLGLEPAAPDETSSDRPPRGRDRTDWTEQEREQWRAQREERRQRRRERWQNASPEQRKRWAERRVSIEPLGDNPPQIEALDILEAMRELRPKMRDCIRSSGGFGVLRDAMRSADAGPRGGLTVSFELSSEGAVNDGSLVISPAPPKAYLACFEQTLSQLDAPVPGGDGAAIELRMGRRGGRPRIPQTEPSNAAGTPNERGPN